MTARLEREKEERLVFCRFLVAPHLFKNLSNKKSDFRRRNRLKGLSDEMTGNTLCTQAWLLIGMTRSIPGVLESTGGRLILTTEQERVFDVSLSEVTDVNFPWYYLGGGVKFKIGTESYRLSFVQPNDGSEIPYYLLARPEFGDPDTFSPAGIREGRQAGKAWKSILTART